MRMNMKEFSNVKQQVKYSSFNIGNEFINYSVTLSGFLVRFKNIDHSDHKFLQAFLRIKCILILQIYDFSISLFVESFYNHIGLCLISF